MKDSRPFVFRFREQIISSMHEIRSFRKFIQDKSILKELDNDEVIMRFRKLRQNYMFLLNTVVNITSGMDKVSKKQFQELYYNNGEYPMLVGIQFFAKKVERLDRLILRVQEEDLAHERIFYYYMRMGFVIPSNGFYGY